MNFDLIIRYELGMIFELWATFELWLTFQSWENSTLLLEIQTKEIQKYKKTDIQNKLKKYRTTN